MLKNIFTSFYGYVKYKPLTRGNQQQKFNKSVPKMALRVPIIAPAKIQINNIPNNTNNPNLEKELANRSRIEAYKTQQRVQNFYKLLDATSLALKESDIPFYLDCGTLLGCIREGRILSHDTDVDVTIHLSAWDKLLTAVDFPKYGLTVKRKYKGFPDYSGGNLISVYLTEDSADNYCDIYANPAFPLLETATMNGKEYPIPKDPGLYLTQLYGNWRVPSSAHADTEYHRNNGLILSDYNKNWDLTYKIYQCKF
uniref:LicD/FKTN/FKRP nucleotidyltransferase domain-containing protein n=1 Tax=viral metagenome TaxID=1070528 RepID=A0A6C0EVT5_9ZZZZ